MQLRRLNGSADHAVTSLVNLGLSEWANSPDETTGERTSEAKEMRVRAATSDSEKP